ncbi:MAG: hypothetical protein F4X57_00080 [Chloroflexi bacterium]|nr:hypothetical protein [Chloroflexota bacterium]
MFEEYPIRVDGPNGEVVAACSEIETAIGLVCASGPRSTIWMGIRNPQKIYTLTEEHSFVGDWFGRWSGEFAYDLDLAVWRVTLTLHTNWADIEAIHEQEDPFLNEQWWERFQQYVSENGDPVLRERADDDDFIEFMKRKAEMEVLGEEDGEVMALRNAIRMTTDGDGDDDLPTLPSPYTF